jgi:hypothetical protein
MLSRPHTRCRPRTRSIVSLGAERKFGHALPPQSHCGAKDGNTMRIQCIADGVAQQRISSSRTVEPALTRRLVFEGRSRRASILILAAAVFHNQLRRCCKYKRFAPLADPDDWATSAERLATLTTRRRLVLP